MQKINDDYFKGIIDYFLETTSLDYEEIAANCHYGTDYFVQKYIKDDMLIEKICGKKTLKEVKEKIEKIEQAKQKKKRDYRKKIFLDILNHPSQDLDEIAKSLGYTRIWLSNNLANENLQKELFSEEVVDKIKKKREQLKQYTTSDENEIRKTHANKLLEFLTLYANSRYNKEETACQVRVNIDTIQDAILEYEQITGTKIDSDLMTKLLERQGKNAYYRGNKASLGKTSFKENGISIENPFYIPFIREKILNVSKAQMRMLNTAISFIINWGDMLKTMTEVKMSYNLVYTDLTSPELEEILKPNYFQLIYNYIKIENIISGQGVSLKEKNTYIREVLKEFMANNFDIEKTSEETTISQYAISRILKNPYIKIIVREKEVLDLIDTVLSSYEELEKEKKK